MTASVFVLFALSILLLGYLCRRRVPSTLPPTRADQELNAAPPTPAKANDLAWRRELSHIRQLRDRFTALSNGFWLPGTLCANSHMFLLDDLLQLMTRYAIEAREKRFAYTTTGPFINLKHFVMMTLDGFGSPMAA